MAGWQADTMQNNQTNLTVRPWTGVGRRILARSLDTVVYNLMSGAHVGCSSALTGERRKHGWDYTTRQGHDDFGLSLIHRLDESLVW